MMLSCKQQHWMCHVCVQIVGLLTYATGCGKFKKVTRLPVTLGLSEFDCRDASQKTNS